MEENLFVYVECSVVRHATSRFSVRKSEKNATKNDSKRVTLGWNDISGPGPITFFILKFNLLHYAGSIQP